MNLVSLHDKAEIEAFLRRNTFLHIYSIGDLDDYFWDNTVWYALKDSEEVREILLLYTALKLPVLLALTEEPAGPMRELLTSAMRLLPRRVYVHLSEGLASILGEEYHIEPHGLYYKMALVDRGRLEEIDTSEVVALSSSDAGELEVLYRTAYPDTSFEPHMLGIGHYYGVRRDGQLVGVAGVHIYSEKYRVAAIGNVATHPEYRGQGIATSACAKLCQELLRTVDHIGLNVQVDNRSAISCYERLGFERVASFEESTLELKQASPARAD